jgi:hypothetical protein
MPEDKQDKPKILIDSDWKQQAEREKEELSRETGPEKKEPEQPHEPLPPPDFLQHCASLATHAMILLGAVPNPMTGQHEFDPIYARHLIDTIVMLRDKAKGNLTPDEEKTLEHLTGELKLAWLSIAGNQKKS